MSVAPPRSQNDVEVEHKRCLARPRLLPTLAAIVAIVVCVAAGNWQRERLHAKEALRAQLDRAARADPVSLARLADDADWAALRYFPRDRDRRIHCVAADPHRQQGSRGTRGVRRRDATGPRRWPRGARRPRLDGAGRVALARFLNCRLRPASYRCAAGSRYRHRRYLELLCAPPAGAVWQNLDPARFSARGRPPGAARGHRGHGRLPYPTMG